MTDDSLTSTCDSLPEVDNTTYTREWEQFQRSFVCSFHSLLNVDSCTIWKNKAYSLSLAFPDWHRKNSSGFSKLYAFHHRKSLTRITSVQIRHLNWYKFTSYGHNRVVSVVISRSVSYLTRDLKLSALCVQIIFKTAFNSRTSDNPLVNTASTENSRCCGSMMSRLNLPYYAGHLFLLIIVTVPTLFYVFRPDHPPHSDLYE